MKKNIGFVGVGTMGKPMAQNLLKAGFIVTICPHKNMEPVRELQGAGARMAASPKEVASTSEVVVLCLPDSPQVEDAVAGVSGVLAGVKPGTIIVDTSTILPSVTQKLAKMALERGVQMIDAPMSGGQVGAINANLTFMCGGDETALNEVRPVLEAMGKKIFHVGAAGMGQVVKICNNLMLGINLVAVAEAFTLGVKAGVKAETLREVISASSGHSAVLDRYLPHTIMKNQYKPGFMLELMCKDIGLALGAAKALGVLLIEGAVATQMLEMMKAQGKGKDDFTIIATFYEDVAGVNISTGQRTK